METSKKEESRIFQKCCFCLPLRGGLLFLAYFNVFGGGLYSFYVALPISNGLDLYLMSVVVDTTGLHNPGIYLLPKLLDLAYGVVLIYALHKNDTLVLYAFLWYSLTYITAVLYTGFMVWGYVLDRGELLLVIAINVVYQGFMAFLVRNLRVELMKTEDSSNEGKSYVSKQSTTDCDVESQPLPTTAPKQIQDLTSL